MDAETTMVQVKQVARIRDRAIETCSLPKLWVAGKRQHRAWLVWHDSAKTSSRRRHGGHLAQLPERRVVRVHVEHPTNMDPNIISAVVGALSGIASAFITAKLTSSASRKQSERVDARDASLLASRIAPDLRAYADQCLAVAYDDGHSEGWPAGENGTAVATVLAPDFKPAGYDVEWRSLPRELLAAIWSFPEHVQTDIKILEDEGFDDPPDHWHYFAERQYIFVKLGVRALSLAERLYAHAKIGTSIQGAALRQKLTTRREQLEQKRAEREERLRMSHEKMLATPQTPSPHSDEGARLAKHGYFK